MLFEPTNFIDPKEFLAKCLLIDLVHVLLRI